MYLRSRANSVREQMMLLPNLQPDELERTFAADGDIVSITIFENRLSSVNPEADVVNGLLARETASVISEAGDRYRAYFRIHLPGPHFRPVVGRIEIRATAGDQLISEAARHLSVALLAAFVSLGTLAAYLLISRRATRLEHLAQLGSMSASLAHEIRNPLGTIKGFVQLSKKKGGENTDRFLEVALREILRLERLVEDLLAYARRRNPVLRAVRWDAIAARVRVPNRDSRVSFESSDLTVTTDPDMIVQILSNLVRNAEEAAENSHVTVRIRADDETVHVLVEDDGPGIPDTIRSQVMQPFVSTKASGTGLGLPICMRLAEALDGRLRLLRRIPRGTIAKLTLPQKNDR
jgi:two-component system sensor histidine kinase HydH